MMMMMMMMKKKMMIVIVISMFLFQLQVAHHIVAGDPRRDWSVKYTLTIEK